MPLAFIMRDVAGAALVSLMLAMPATAAPVPSTDISAQRMMACTREYRPVCARLRHGAVRTFPNRCEARRAGARIIAKRACALR
jgi:hypothetical protein